jgi:predicted ATPase/class 3 adenylate cyclase/DNA-binding SARP family transcriptional activator
MPDFGVLGPLLIRDDSGVVELPGRRRRSILIRLLTSANRPLVSDRLIEDVWDGRPPDGASQTLQSHISALRRVLGGDRIRHSAGGYVIDIADGELDVETFERESTSGFEAFANGELERAARTLGVALDQWRGPALIDVTDSAWSVPICARLDQLRVSTLETFHDTLLALGKPERVLPTAEAAVLEQPLHEGLCKGLMLALYRCGRQAEAIRAYERLRRELSEIGLVPSPSVAALEQAILEQSPDLQWQAQEPQMPSGPVALAAPESGVPTGVVTLLFTDIEGSSRLWEQHPAAMSEALGRHDELVRKTIGDHSGHVFKTVGDAFCAAFTTASDAVMAAASVQRVIWDEPWPEQCEIRVRIALHTGECVERSGDYFGPTVNRIARLVSSAHGGQTVMSRVTADLVRDGLPQGATLQNLGILRLKGLGQPEQVFGLKTGDLPSEFPPLALVQREDGDMPAELTRLIGRDELVTDLIDEIRTTRLISLTGPGGIGKTRLAVRVASSVGQPFEDGVRFVDLSVIPGDGGTTELVLSELHGVPASDETALDAILRVLGPARLLLVLDNCEHQLEQVRSLTEAVIRHCRWVHVLTTSRAALGTSGERCVEVPPLELPRTVMPDLLDLQLNPSIRLFEMHARMVDHHFALSSSNVATVASICRSIGGVPLAIELAARQLDVITVDELAQEVGDERVLPRLAVEGRPEPRLSSIAASLQWSLGLLSDTDQRLFASLGVFAGSFSREQALELVEARPNADMAHAFDRLVRLSLITRDSPGTVRFRMFQPSREFANSLLEPARRRSLQRRHARIMRDLAERFGSLLRTDREAEACINLSADFPDHRQAVAWCFEHSLEDAARMVIGLFQFCQFQMLSEVNDWSMRLTQVLEPTSPMATQVFGAAALGAWFVGDMETAIALAERALAAAPSPRDPSALWARLALIDANAYLGRFDELPQNLEAIAAYSKQSGDRFWKINNLGFSALGRLGLGDTAGATRDVDRAIALARDLNNPDCTHWAMHCLGHVLSKSDLEAACVAFEQAMDAAGSVGSRWNLSLDLLEWSSLKRRLGELPAAAQGLLELLELLLASGNRSQRSQFYYEAARILSDWDKPDAAFMIMVRRAGMPAMPPTAEVVDESFEMGVERAVGLRAAGLRVRARTMTENELVVLCRSHLEEVARNGASLRGSHDVRKVSLGGRLRETGG